MPAIRSVGDRCCSSTYGQITPSASVFAEYTRPPHSLLHKLLILLMTARCSQQPLRLVGLGLRTVAELFSASCVVHSRVPHRFEKQWNLSSSTNRKKNQVAMSFLTAYFVSSYKLHLKQLKISV